MPYDAPVNVEDLPELDPIFSKIIPPLDEPLGSVLNHPHMRAAEIPGANISASARALAKHYAATVSEVDGCRLISNDHLELIFSHQADLPDVFMNKTFGIRQETPRILGYQKILASRIKHFTMVITCALLDMMVMVAQRALLILGLSLALDIQKPYYTSLHSPIDRLSCG